MVCYSIPMPVCKGGGGSRSLLICRPHSFGLTYFRNSFGIGIIPLCGNPRLILLFHQSVLERRGITELRMDYRLRRIISCFIYSFINSKLLDFNKPDKNDCLGSVVHATAARADPTEISTQDDQILISNCNNYS